MDFIVFPSHPTKKTWIRAAIRYTTWRPNSNNANPYKVCRSLLAKPHTISYKRNTKYYVQNNNSFPKWLLRLLYKWRFQIIPQIFKLQSVTLFIDLEKDLEDIVKKDISFEWLAIIYVNAKVRSKFNTFVRACSYGLMYLNTNARACMRAQKCFGMYMFNCMFICLSSRNYSENIILSRHLLSQLYR